MFTEEELTSFNKWLDLYYDTSCGSGPKKHKSKSERDIFVARTPCPIISKIEYIYNSGDGLKSIAKNLGINYSPLRVIFNKHNVQIRQGRNVVTDKLREKRKENALNWEDNPFREWTTKYPELALKNGRGLQGYYKRKNGEYVWLRSTYEYIFAKWLDKINADWVVEFKRYKLENGETYLPDFFIFEDNKLAKIVEIKGDFYQNQKHKPELLNEQLDVPVILITDITRFTDKTYGKEQKQWRQVRLNREQLEELNK